MGTIFGFLAMVMAAAALVNSRRARAQSRRNLNRRLFR